MVTKVKRPEPRKALPLPCSNPKSKGEHLLVVVENPHNTDTYLAKCKWCGRLLQKHNDA